MYEDLRQTARDLYKNKRNDLALVLAEAVFAKTVYNNANFKLTVGREDELEILKPYFIKVFLDLPDEIDRTKPFVA